MIHNFKFMEHFLSWALKLTISFVLLFYLFDKSNSDYIKLILTYSNKYYFLPILFLLFAQIIFAVNRWKSMIFFLSKKKIHFNSLLQNYFTSSFLGNFFLGSIGFDFYRFLFLKNYGLSVQKNLSILILDRLFIALSCFFVCYFGLALFLLQFKPSYFFNFVFLTLFSCLIIFLLLLNKLHFYFSKLFFLYRDFVKSFKFFFFNRFFLNILFSMILNSIFVYMIFSSLKIFMPFIFCFFLSASILLVSAFPFSISGWGTREFFLVKILSYYNIDFNTALTFSILYGFFVFIISTPGAFLLTFSFFFKKNFFLRKLFG